MNANPQTSFKTFRAKDWLTLAALILSSFVVWLNVTILNTDLPMIEKDLNASLSELQWAVSIFSLCGGFIIVSGRLADNYGRKHILSIGLICFIVGSAICGFAGNIEWLIAGRAIQGIGGAMMLPASLALVEVSFHPPVRTTAIGLWIGLAWFAQALGPSIGGFAAETTQWQWAFHLTTLLAIITLILTLTSVKKIYTRPDKAYMDYLGAALIMIAMFAIIYSAIASGSTGWLQPSTLGLFFFGLLASAIFILVEHKTKHPVASLILFKDRAFLGANVVNIISNTVFASLVLYAAIYLEIVMDYQPFTVGLLLLPPTLSILFTLQIGSKIYNHAGARMPTSVGMIMLTSGCLVIGLLTPHLGYNAMLAPFLIIGLGIGLFASPITAAALAASSHEAAGRAAALFKASSMIGAALGIAFAGSIYQTMVSIMLHRHLASAPENIRETLYKIAGGNKHQINHLKVISPGEWHTYLNMTIDYINIAFTATVLVLAGIALLTTIFASIIIPKKHHFFAVPSDHGN
ncbi:MFS transporter [Poriferisphaera sp. WC338]|uniref:MFS transporter n=1 Tax=Poriferisphaera sp. WC338 TaxID=3425129 RepID=UPI003D816956